VDPTLAQHVEYLLRAGVAGTSTSHGADDNLYKINLLLKHGDSTTFGMEEALCGVGFEEAYEAVTHHLGYPPDVEENPGRGCIDPSRTAAGL
jgi:hypothetical protein